MDTTVVAQTAIGALVGLGGGLGGAMIAVRSQRSAERDRLSASPILRAGRAGAWMLDWSQASTGRERRGPWWEPLTMNMPT